MTQRLVHSKMLLGNTDELVLCYAIKCTADDLASYAKSDLRSRYVQALETSAARTMMYWKLLDCLTAEKQKCLPLASIKDNALVAAIGADEDVEVRKLLEDRVNAASSTPLFGEALATATSSGSLTMVHLLLHYWDWETHEHLAGLRLMNAVEAAASAGHDRVLTEILNHKNRIARSTYDDAVIRMVRSNQAASVGLLLNSRRADLTPAAKEEFWLRFMRTAAECGQWALLQTYLPKIQLDIEEALLVRAMNDACLENHEQAFHTIMSHLPVYDSTRYADSLFWAAGFGNTEVMNSLLTSLQYDQRALLLALAGAVSTKAYEAVVYLLKVAGVSLINEDVPTRFTDIARLLLPKAFTHVVAQSAKPLSVSTQVENLRAATRAGRLADVITILQHIKVHHPNDSLVGVSAAFSDAAKANHLDVLLFLCENWTPHLVTSCVKSPAVAQIFINFGWDVCQTDQGSKYPRLGSFVYDEHFVRWLLRKGASADARGEFDVTAVSVAICRAPMSTIRLLLDHSSSGIQHGQLLHFAMQRSGEDSLEVVELLLNLGCPIDSIWFRNDERSWLEWGIGEAGTALFNAAEQGRDDIVAYLLSRGADATIVSNKGRTALDVARSNQRFGSVRLLGA
ncbi:ankyrin [Cucurbitaria berberidis CBS 394.84]|uniref:Ankyrin n=1 Tax=Cucurbitaria berberidis CBS 394.84 TaxID=1168544 RepID=A0A9P4G9B3_9PLEO|nr:ankyrin [Cucurbitaria berberidis CBS 394.84]KAF1841349.1 ankyrin [Cucurbitaria berberidis CBS 394.84]